MSRGSPYLKGLFIFKAQLIRYIPLETAAISYHVKECFHFVVYLVL